MSIVPSPSNPLSRPTSAVATHMAKPPADDSGFVDLVLHEDKQCKGSVRYSTNDPESPISSLYLSRKFQAQMPKSIVVTITAK